MFFGKRRSPCDARAVASQKGNGPAQQADETVEPQRGRHGDAGEILKEHERDRQANQDQQRNSPGPESLDVGVQADRSEEIEEQEVARGQGE